MRIVMNILASAAGLYMILIFVRIMFGWFGIFRGGPVDILARITDPYLDWWKNRIKIRTGVLDFRPVAALAALSMAQSVFSAIGRSGSISAGLVLAIVLSAVWSALSFIMVFLFIVLVLRLIAFLTNRDTYSPFWYAVDSVSRPVIYGVTRFFFRRRILRYLNSVIFSMAVIILLFILGRVACGLAARFLVNLPF
jgi:uncharacterized protein YggT (Ycf19 family)